MKKKWLSPGPGRFLGRDIVAIFGNNAFHEGDLEEIRCALYACRMMGKSNIQHSTGAARSNCNTGAAAQLHPSAVQQRPMTQKGA